MPDDLDIWRSANLLIQQHGDDAGLVAAQRADDLLARGALESSRTRLRIMKAIEELQAAKPPAGAKAN